MPLYEAARYVPYSQDYLGLLARRGKIDAKKIGRNWHTTREAVLAYYDTHNDSDNPIVDGKDNGIKRPVYISLAEAATHVPYTQEYLGLLARKGKLDAKKIGRNWYTTHEAVLDYYDTHNDSDDFAPKDVDSRLEHLDQNASFPREEIFYGVPFEPRNDPAQFININEVESNQNLQSGLSYLSPTESKEQNRGSSFFSQSRQDEVGSGQPNQEANLGEIGTELSSQPKPQTPPSISESPKDRFNIGNFRPSAWIKTLRPAAIILFAAVILFILFGGARTIFVNKVIAGTRDFFKDAVSLQGKFPGTHANELLVLDSNCSIDIYGSIKTKTQLVSDAPDGVAPLVVISKTTIANLSSQYLDGISKQQITLSFVTQNGNVTQRKVKLLGGTETTDLVATGNTTLNTLTTNTLTTDGAVSFRGTLSVEGLTTLSNLLVQKNIVVEGFTDLQGVAMGGNLDVGGALTVVGSGIFRGRLEAQYIFAPQGVFGWLGTGSLSAGEVQLGSQRETVRGDIYASGFTITEAGDATFNSLNVPTLSASTTTFDGNIILNSPYGITLNAGNITGNQLSVPSGLSATASTTSGSLGADTYYYVVTALNSNGETTG